VSFGAREGIVFVQGTATLGAAGDTISSNGLTIGGLGAATGITLTLGGKIVDGTQPSRLIITSTTTGSSLTIGGANTYTRGTIFSVNTGASTNIVIGSDTAFGTGKVTNILAPGASSPQLQANATRTLANAFDLNGGVTFTGTNSIAFTGPINIIQPQAGGSRT